MRLIIFSIIFICSGFLNTEAQQTGCIYGNCTDGYGVYVWTSGDKFIGEWKNGYRDGWGVYYFISGITYVGGFKSNKLDGYGFCKWADGEKYIGDWKNGGRTGQGTYWYKDGTKKSGRFENDVFSSAEAKTGCISGDCDNGWGVYIWGYDSQWAGEKYDGYWLGSAMSGYGTYYYASGAKYVGAFINNKLDGQGIYYWANGDKYDGGWKEGKKDGYGKFFYYDTGETKSGYWSMDSYQGTSGYSSTSSTGSSGTGCISGNCTDGYGTYKFASGDKYVGYFKTGTYSGQGTYTFADGKKYIGEWKDGSYNGYGTLYYTDGTSKSGTWKDNNYVGSGSSTTSSYSTASTGCTSGDCDNGYGVWIFASGEKYEGYWVNKMRNGFGTNYFTSGAKYTGNWKDDFKSGYGIYEYAPTTKYEKYIGNFVEDKLTGQGTLYYKDGTKESGNWKDNVFQGAYSSDYTYNSKKGSKGCIAGNCDNGYGMYVFDSGDKYAGEWNNGKREGQGVYYYKSGVIYTGNFKNNNLHGYGYCKWTDGSYYIGEWADGSINGQGGYYYASGSKDVGYWRDTKLVNKDFKSGCVSGNCDSDFGTFIWAADSKWAGHKYTGYWKGGERNGQGTYYYADGAKYVGSFKNNSLTGQGTYFWNNGDKYEGDWIKSKMDGYGTYFYADDASTETGYWSNGKFVGNSSSDYSFSNNNKTNTGSANTGCISGNCNDGYGVYIWPSGEKYEGNWKNDSRNGQGTNYFTTGAVHIGMWKNDLKNGYGTYTYKKESIYEKYIGDFIDDKMTGKGELYYRDGTNYKGYFKDNLFEGEGTFIHADGKVEKGTWAKDKLIKTSDGMLVSNTTNTNSSNTNNNVTTNTNNAPKDNVDQGIPENLKKNPYRFALIFGNEDYSSYQQDLKSEVNVEFAERDAKVFKEYATKTFGIPDENVVLKINAKAMEMHKELNKLNLLMKSANGKAEVFFYYAGHGIPDEETKEPYLVPVDVSGTDLQFAVKLADVYRKLSEYPSKKVTVFLDACFSGGARNQGMINARGVKIKPKETPIKGNIIIFTSSSGEQSSLAYKEAQHGMFTYHLLKKLKETQGDISYKELAEYLNEQVGMKSVMINNKEQTPQTIVSPEVQDKWALWKIKE
ncbi:MAG: caspase family protein [Bacteroidia bacterium]|nr:caspase family protein [Bacteroidia bacterium]